MVWFVIGNPDLVESCFSNEVIKSFLWNFSKMSILFHENAIFWCIFTNFFFDFFKKMDFNARTVEPPQTPTLKLWPQIFKFRFSCNYLYENVFF